MNIYIMRHGTTIWNEKGITQGRTNNRLSKKGIELTNKVSEEYKDINFDIIYASPLFRTIQTANIMNKYHNVKIVKNLNLIEIDQGYFTGKHKDDLTKEEKIVKNKRLSEYGMESYESVCNRCKLFLNELVTKSYKNVLIITHNCSATLLEDLIKEIKIDYNNPQHLRNFNNAEIKKFTISNNNLTGYGTNMLKY